MNDEPKATDSGEQSIPDTNLRWRLHYKWHRREKSWKVLIREGNKIALVTFVPPAEIGHFVHVLGEMHGPALTAAMHAWLVESAQVLKPAIKHTPSAPTGGDRASPAPASPRIAQTDKGTPAGEPNGKTSPLGSPGSPGAPPRTLPRHLRPPSRRKGKR